MDRTQDSDSCNAGSIPTGCIIIGSIFVGYERGNVMSKKRRHSASNKNQNKSNQNNHNTNNQAVEEKPISTADFLANARQSMAEIEAEKTTSSLQSEAYVPVFENGQSATNKTSSVSSAGKTGSQTTSLPVDAIKEAVSQIYDAADQPTTEPVKPARTIKQTEIPHSKYEEPPTFGENVIKIFELIGAFVVKHKKYFIAGGLFAVIVVIVGISSFKLKENASDNITDVTDEIVDENDAYAGIHQEFRIDAIPEINALIEDYYQSYADGDADKVAEVATPLSDTEKSYIAIMGQFIDSYKNIMCYTKVGIKEGDYVVSAYYDMKLAGVDTLASGMDIFYVTTNETGSYIIDNAYSNFNQSNMENSTQPDIQALIIEYSNLEDVQALMDEVGVKYNEAIASDSALAEMVESTIPNAISAWTQSLTNPDADDPNSDTEIMDTKTAYCKTDDVNVRSGRGTGYEAIGKLKKGEEVQIVKNTNENGWVMIVYNDQNGYVMREFLTTKEEMSGTDNGAGDTSEGGERTMTVNEALNIRSMMTTDSDLMGTTNPGDQITIILDYAEGWTKVKWKKKTGYIRTDLLY